MLDVYRCNLGVGGVVAVLCVLFDLWEHILVLKFECVLFFYYFICAFTL